MCISNGRFQKVQFSFSVIMNVARGGMISLCGEHLAYIASRRLHEKKLFKSLLSRLAHNRSVYGGSFEK